MSVILSAVGLDVPLPAVVEDVCQLAEDRLRESPYHTLRHVSCEFRDGVLILRGTVDSYYLKQVAQTAVAKLPLVDAVDNRVEVADR